MEKNAILEVLDNNILNYYKKLERYEKHKELVKRYIESDHENSLIESFLKVIGRIDIKKLECKEFDMHYLYTCYEEVINETHITIIKEESERNMIESWLNAKETRKMKKYE